VLTRVQLKGGIWWVAQSQAVIHDVPTCAQVVERIVSDAHMIVEIRFARIVNGFDAGWRRRFGVTGTLVR
jgi:NADH:quinone reductase (non-electrogenic)